jgi:hypothetical protein
MRGDGSWWEQLKLLLIKVSNEHEELVEDHMWRWIKWDEIFLECYKAISLIIITD